MWEKAESDWDVESDWAEGRARKRREKKRHRWVGLMGSDNK